MDATHHPQISASLARALDAAEREAERSRQRRGQVRYLVGASERVHQTDAAHGEIEVAP